MPTLQTLLEPGGVKSGSFELEQRLSRYEFAYASAQQALETARAELRFLLAQGNVSEKLMRQAELAIATAMASCHRYRQRIESLESRLDRLS